MDNNWRELVDYKATIETIKTEETDPITLESCEQALRFVDSIPLLNKTSLYIDDDKFINIGTEFEDYVGVIVFTGNSVNLVKVVTTQRVLSEREFKESLKEIFAS